MRSLFRRRSGRLLLLVAVCLPLGAHSAPPATLLNQVQQLLAGRGTPIGARLSGVPSPPVHRGMQPDFSRDVNVLLREIGTRLKSRADAAALHAAALLDLGWPDSAGVSVNRAIAQLQGSLDAGGPSAARLSDLSAAYLARAERGGGLLDVHHAVEAADRALEMDSLYAPAQYNLALALDGLMLDSVAVRAWVRFQTLEPRSGWSAEAARRQKRLSQPTQPWRGGRRSLAASAAAFPQVARVFAVDTVFSGWGSAVLRGDSAAAARWLAQADRIAGALAGLGGDGTVAEMVGSIRRLARDPAGMRRLAWAHAAYARAQARLATPPDGPAALVVLDSIRAQPLAAPALARWTAYSRVLALFYSGRGEEAAQACSSLVDSVDATRFPVLAGRVQWSLGTLALRGGAYPAARERYAGAARHFERAREREYLGTVQELEAEALFGMGDARAAYERLGAALATLRPYRSSVGLHNLLVAAAAPAAIARGFHRTALLLHDEDVEVTSRLDPGVHAEALLLRARTLVAAGEPHRARADVERSRAMLAAVPRDFRGWLYEDVLVAEAQLALGSDPRRAVAALDTAVDHLPGARARARLVAALVHRADARLRTGDEAGAASDLERAAANRDSLKSDVQSAAVRASMAEAGRRVFDRMAMLHVNAGRLREALIALERGRAVFGPGGVRTAAPLAAPGGEVVLDYALIGDTLLAFVVRGERVHLARSTVDREGVIGDLNRVLAALELRAPTDSLLSRLGALHAVLLGPLRAHLPAGAPLVVVADGEIAAAPFPGLWDAAGRRYLLQAHRIRFAPTIADAASPSRPGAGRAVFVADPAFEPRAYPGLGRLAHTEAGVRRVAAAYPGSAVIAGRGAGRDSIIEALSTAALFHFAGHAVFDADRPTDSYLVLAGAPPSGRLTAAELERMNLRGLRLVVLSACETQRSASGRSGGFAGLSGALLAAGAGGVVGSLWRVNDDLTRALMDEFHPAYRASGDGAQALRQAQLRLLASPDPALRSPSAWAGFRYAGS